MARPIPLAAPKTTAASPRNHSSMLTFAFCPITSLPVQLVNLVAADFAAPEPAIAQLLAFGIDVHAAGGTREVGRHIHHMDVEDVRPFGFGLEPMDVVLVVGDGRHF